MSKVAVVYWSGTGNTAAMGADVLEEMEFQPMWDEVKDNISDKKSCSFTSSRIRLPFNGS